MVDSPTFRQRLAIGKVSERDFDERGTCPECRKRILEKTAGRNDPGYDFECPGCGNTVQIKSVPEHYNNVAISVHSRNRLNTTASIVVQHGTSAAGFVYQQLSEIEFSPEMVGTWSPDPFVLGSLKGWKNLPTYRKSS